VHGVHVTDLKQINKHRHLYDGIAALSFRSPSISKRFREIEPSIWASAKHFVALSGIESEHIVSVEDAMTKWEHTEPTRFLTVSSLIPRKHIDVNLRALATMSSGRPWTYDIVGDGPMREALEELSRSLGLSDRVSFYGFRKRSDCLEMMTESHFFLLVSDQETFGLAYLEAMSKGMVPIAGKGCGIDGIITEGTEGYLCTPGSVEDQRRVLTKVLDSGGETIVPNVIRRISTLTRENAANSYLSFLRGVAI